ncbi:hypothetical protein EZZ76_10715 [Neisseria meningitidis]|nr:hypothetical protein [Neisseria meningitidis]
MLLQRSQSTIKTVGHLQPSFPRRRESRISMPQEFIGKNQNLSKTKNSNLNFIGKYQNPSAVIPTENLKKPFYPISFRADK